MWSVPSRVQGALDGGADVGRAAVGDAGPAAGVGDEAELGGDDDLVAAALDRLADELLAVERAVDLGGVDVGDAQVQRAVDGADRLGVVEAPAAGVGAGHGHGAQADPGDVQPAERDVLHQVAPSRSSACDEFQVTRRRRRERSPAGGCTDSPPLGPGNCA